MPSGAPCSPALAFLLVLKDLKYQSVGRVNAEAIVKTKVRHDMMAASPNKKPRATFHRSDASWYRRRLILVNLTKVPRLSNHG